MAAAKVKPWCGPLPRRRTSPKVSLGDIWVKDVRKAGKQVVHCRLREVQDAVLPDGDAGKGPTSVTPATGPDSDSEEGEHFDFQREETRRLRGCGDLLPKVSRLPVSVPGSVH
ncbi:unnamed protein product [Urochloa humidicola]